MKCILNFWRAKDIPEVVDEFDKLDIDKLEFKYMRYPEPMKALDTLTKSGILDDYDYIILTSPDLVVKEENLKQLLEDIEKTNAKVVAGCCNVDLGLRKNDLAVCMNPVNGRRYIWVPKGKETGIKEVGFNGMILMAVHRDVWKNFKFYEGSRDDPIDLKICRWCIAHEYKVLTNFDNYMHHMRYTGEMMAGRKTPEIIMNGRKIKTQTTNTKIPFILDPVEFE